MAYMRVLVAFEDDYRSYRETMATCLRIRRPDVEVETARLEVLNERLEEFAPEVVICSGDMAMYSDDGLAWIELSLDLNMPARITVDGRSRNVANPSLEQLLVLIDETVLLTGRRSHNMK
jgi:ActR/RegA family two-component response regulator